MKNTNFSPKQQILSNVNPLRLEQLIAVLEETNRKNPFLDPHKNPAIVERNFIYQEQISEELLSHLIPSGYTTSPVENQPYLPYHNLERMCHVLNHQPNDPNEAEAISRTKGTDAYAEKNARQLAEDGTLNNLDYLLHLSVEDLYALTLITSTLQECYRLKDKVLSLTWDKIRDPKSKQVLPFTFEEEEDYYEGIRTDKFGHQEPLEPRSYNAIHHSLRWKNKVLELDELRLELKYLTQEDYQKNEQGDPQHPGRAHPEYKRRKLKESHTFRDHHGKSHQMIVIDYHESPAFLPRLNLIPQLIDLSPFLKLKYSDERISYHLLKPAT